MTLQRRCNGPAEPNAVPAIVHEVLRSPGRPLDGGTRSIMEPRFGRDFSTVRIHTDSLAAESAHSVNALAYTVGRRVVFGEGQYAPMTPAGRQLIAHELTHVVQQNGNESLLGSIGPVDDAYEREADRASANVNVPHFEDRLSVVTPVLQREDKEKKKKPPAASKPVSDAPPKAPAAPPGGPVRGMKTSCDVKIDPRDVLDFQLKKSVRTVGAGQPQIGNLYPGLEATNPCLVEAGRVHEEQHVKNNTAACQAFKKCIDDHSSKTLGLIGDPRISHDDFVRCHNDNHNGNTPDCIADEKSAYEVMIRKARELIAEARCAKEKALLQQNITYWESIKNHDPDCDPPKQ